MWIIGSTTDEEVKSIKEMGYKIDCIVKPKDFSKLTGNNSSPFSNDDFPDLVVIYIADSVENYLRQRHGQEQSRIKLEKEQELAKKREQKAQELWEDYDTGVRVLEADGWETDSNHYLIKFYYEPKVAGADDGDSLAATFTVQFKPDTDEVIDKGINW